MTEKMRGMRGMISWVRQVRAERRAARKMVRDVLSDVDSIASQERILARERIAKRAGYLSVSDMLESLEYDPLVEDKLGPITAWRPTDDR
jgi:hypothetical protein